MKKRLSLSKLTFGSKLAKISENITSPIQANASPMASSIRLLKTITNINTKQAPSSVDMQSISRVTYGSKSDMKELESIFLEKLSSDLSIVILKTLTILSFVFKTGSDVFYQQFIGNGKGIWKLKSLINYSSDDNSDICESIRLKASELVTYCENPEYLEFKKTEFKRLRNSMTQPTPRSSFDMNRNSFGDGRKSQSIDFNTSSREEILRELKLEDDHNPIQEKTSWHGRLRRLTNINEETE